MSAGGLLAAGLVVGAATFAFAVAMVVLGFALANLLMVRALAQAFRW